jgi:nucleotide-binding universal stress UspA family protein
VFEKVLVPLDSARGAESVLPYVEELAGHLNSEVTLLYVCEEHKRHDPRVHELYLGIIADGVKSNIKERYPRKRGTGKKVNSVVLLGSPYEEIQKYAEENDIGLVVLATRCGSGIMHRSIGQIPSKLFEKARVPLLLIATASSYPEPNPRQLLDRILLPLDGSDSGEAALPYVAELAKKQWAQVTLFRVIEPRQHVHTVGGLTDVKFTEQQIETMKIHAKQYLESVGQKLGKTKAFVRYEIRVGDTDKEVINLTNEANARLVAVSTHRFSGSVAQKILQATNTPLLLVRAPA